MRDTFVRTLLEIAKKDKNVYIITGDLGFGVLKPFWTELPNQIINAGIAEQNMISIAAGIAATGKKVVCSSFAMFAAGRAYEQVGNSIGYPHLNVKIGATHAGITVGEDGATHQMLEDINLMRGLPNMTVISPADDVEAKWAVREAAKIEGPVYIRFGRAATPIISASS